MPCIDGVCGPKSKEPSPVDHYRTLSFSLLSDATGGVTVESSGQTVAALGLGASVRGVVQGVVIGAQLSVVYESLSTLGGSTSIGLVEPGASLGYAVGLSDHIVLTPAVRGLFALPFTSSLGTSSTMELTGEVSLAFFLGMNGFIEPYVAAGDYQDFAAGSGAFLFLAGYRLGVVF